MLKVFISSTFILIGDADPKNSVPCSREEFASHLHGTDRLAHSQRR